MTLYAYLRVSTDMQDVNNQKLGVLEYCAAQKLGMPDMVSDTISGKVDWQQREIGKLLGRCAPGDVLVVAEISRLARSTLQVLEIMKKAASVEVAIHVVKNAMVMNGSMQSKIYATIFGLAAEIERDFISQRTREGLARCKVDGIVLGRPRGVALKLGLDDQAKKINEYQALKLNKRAIAKLLGVSPNTLYAWLRRRRPESVDAGEVADSGTAQPIA
jgi:DNA invertase Pin-like site-specific DNA recombinase